MKLRVFSLSLLFACLGLTLCFLIPRASAEKAKKPIEAGMQLPPDFKLAAPSSDRDRQYLGLTSQDPFAVTQIPAKLVLVEVFHVLCQYCQKQAPEMNRIYQYIEEDSALRGNIKLFSIGIQSDPKALEAFKKTFNVKFPILPDQQLQAFTQLGDPQIPFLLLVDKQGKVLVTHGGFLKETDNFFRKIKDFYRQQ